MREDRSCGKLNIKALGLRKLVISLHSEYPCFYTSLVNFSTFVYFPARVGVNAQITQPNYSETNRAKSHKVKYKTSPAVTRCISETLGWKCKRDAKYQHFHRFVNFCYARVKKRVSICCNVVATLLQRWNPSFLFFYQSQQRRIKLEGLLNVSIRNKKQTLEFGRKSNYVSTNEGH